MVHFSKTHCGFIAEYSESHSLNFGNNQARTQALHTELVFPAITLLMLNYISLKVDIIQNPAIGTKIQSNCKEAIKMVKAALYL